MSRVKKHDIWDSLSAETRKDLHHLSNQATNIRGLLTLAVVKLIDLDKEFGIDNLADLVGEIRAINKKIKATEDGVSEMLIHFDVDVIDLDAR